MRLRTETLLVFCGLLCLFLFTHCGFDTSEGIYHYAIAERIVRHGELSLPDRPEGIYTTAPNGRTYGSHEIGNTLFMLPVAWVNVQLQQATAGARAERPAALFTRFLGASLSAVHAAWGAACLFLLLRVIFGQAARQALLGTLLMALTTFWWAYSRQRFDGVLCGALLTLAAFCLFRHRQVGGGGWLAAAGAALGFGVITRLSMALPLLAAVLYVLLLHRHWRQRGRALLTLGVVLLPFAGWQLYYNHLRTGSALTSPVQTAQYAANNGLSGDLLTGVAGLLFSPGKSIFLYAPLLLVSLWAWPRFARQHRPEAIFLAATGLLWLLLHAKLQSWYGASGWGPRHFITVVPLLSLPALTLPRQSRPWLPAVLAAGLLLNAAALTGNWHYRATLAHEQHRATDAVWVWSWTSNQAIDMVRGAALNVPRLAGLQPYELVPAASAENVAASNTLNLWWVTAARGGLSAAPPAAGVLLLAAAGCWWRVIARRPLLSAGWRRRPPPVAAGHSLPAHPPAAAR